MASRRRRRPPPTSKTLRDQAFTGHRGANLTERVVLEMGCAWIPVPGAFDAGIDGHIELRHPDTGAMLNTLVRVQSKATAAAFARETAGGFDFTCDERDLVYWLSSNTPVLVVVSRPGADEAYWVSVKDYFRDPVRRQSRTVHFDKTRDRFTALARDAIFRLAVSRDVGLYIAPPPLAETLYSNLLQVTRLPDRLFLAETSFTARRRVDESVRNAGGPPISSEYVLRGKRILSVHDLTAPHWAPAVDRGTVDEFPGWEWAETTDADRLADFLELVHRCLGARLRPLGVRFNPDREYFFFEATADLAPRPIKYRSMRRDSERFVFQHYTTKKSGEPVREFYRHYAFGGRFRRYDGVWFLEITPTYRFTSDGWNVLRFEESKLKGIKALEKNATVLGQVVMWADLLRGRHEQAELFDAGEDYPFLGFGELETFGLDVGINEPAWLATEENQDADATGASRGDLPLFRDGPKAAR